MPSLAENTVLSIEDDDLTNGSPLDANTGAFAETSLDRESLADLDQSLANSADVVLPPEGPEKDDFARGDGLGEMESFSKSEPKSGVSLVKIAIAIAIIGGAAFYGYTSFFSAPPVSATSARLATVAKPAAIAAEPAPMSAPVTAPNADPSAQLPAPTEAGLRASPDAATNGVPASRPEAAAVAAMPGDLPAPAAAKPESVAATSPKVDGLAKTDPDFNAKITALDQRLTSVESSVGGLKSQVLALAANMDKFMATIRSKLSSQTEGVPATVGAPSATAAAPRAPKKRSVQVDLPVVSEKPVTHTQTATRTDMVLQAIVPGRAWLRGENGDFVTVTIGDVIDGVGKVVEIDINRSAVITTGGTFLAE